MPVKIRTIRRLVNMSSTIASGLMAERADFRAALAYSFLAGLVIYPIFGHWVWGGGWLGEMGHLDFAGSSVVNLVGAYIGLAGTIMLGKRQDKGAQRAWAPTEPGGAMATD